MGYFRLAFKPGIDKQNTEYGSEGGWIDSDHVRFRFGLPEKIGGWERLVSTPVILPVPGPANVPLSLIGQASDLFTWNALDGSPYAVIGTNRKLYIYSGGQYFDITPLRSTRTGLTFTTTIGNATATVNLSAHGAIPGDFVTISNTTGNPGSLPNATFDQQFEIQSIIDANQFTILLPTQALSTGVAVGSASAVFEITIGNDVSFFDYGWGTGTWGLSTWGTPRPPGIINRGSQTWQFDIYGEDLIAGVVDGPIYEWSPTTSGVGTRAQILSGAPTRSRFSLISTPDRHLVCLGTETIVGDRLSVDPMFVRFSSQEDITEFSETATNTAGGQRLTDGSKILSGIRSRGQILIFTDTSLHGMQYIGPPYTFGFQQLGANCGCISPHAAVDVNGLAFWMGTESFYVFDGTVKKLPCTVQDYVFKDLNIIQGEKVYAGVNSQFNEVTWWYCSFTSDYIDRFVSFNYVENCWHVGTMPRTAWSDLGTFDRPLAVQYFENADYPVPSPQVQGLTAGRSVVYRQEVGYNGDNAAINAYIRSGYFDIGDGDQMLFMKRFIPDFKNQVGNVVVRLLLRPYPQASASPSSLDPYVVTPTTQKIDTRARGRQISLGIESVDLNTNWRYGTMRVDIQPDGLR
jgi:hypothetical protein